MADAADDAGVPPGVINWLPADREVGAYLVSHPGVDKVAFTGSTAAGRKIGAVCAELLRPCSLELGGKSAGIILDDVDIDALLEGLGFALRQQRSDVRQDTRCSCPTVATTRSRARSREWADGLTVGDPLDPTTQIGPVASEAHRDVVTELHPEGQGRGSR